MKYNIDGFESEQDRLAAIRAMNAKLARDQQNAYANRSPRAVDADTVLLRAVPRPLPPRRPSGAQIAVVVALALFTGLAVGVGVERAWTAQNAVEVRQ